MRKTVYVSCLVLAFLGCITLFSSKAGYRALALVVYSSHSSLTDLQDKILPPANKQNATREEAKARTAQEDELDALLAQARSNLPEIIADTFFQLIDSATIKDDAKKLELLEEVFNSATSAQFKVKQTDTSGATDTRSGSLDYGYSLNLDTLSIQCNVVKRMLLIDKQKARESFKRITIPELKPIECENPMVYDLAIYYDTLRDVSVPTLAAAVNDPAIRQDVIYDLFQAINEIKTPLQLAPVIGAIVSLKLSPQDLQYLIQGLNDKLREVTGDPRSFIKAVEVLGKEFKRLVLFCINNGTPVDDLLSRYRLFLQKNMAKKWCGDLGNEVKVNEAKMLSLAKKQADAFNQVLTDPQVTESPKVTPLQTVDLLPRGIERPARIYEYWRTPVSEEMLKGVRGLRYGAGREQLAVATKEQTPWQAELANFYTSFTSWSNTSLGEKDVSEADFFHQKCIIFGGLLELVPQSNPQYEGILRDYTAFLSENRARQINTAAWLWQTKLAFLRLAQVKRSTDYVEKAYADSTDDVLRLIARTKKYIAKYKK